jgi:hypothetical protein
LTSGPIGSRFGVGQSIGPAWMPAGKVHSSVVGRPESPGFFQ